MHLDLEVIKFMTEIILKNTEYLFIKERFKSKNQNSLKCMRNDFSLLTEMTSEVTKEFSALSHSLRNKRYSRHGFCMQKSEFPKVYLGKLSEWPFSIGLDQILANF